MPATTANDGVNVVIAWQVTPNTRFSPVFAYKILVKRQDGTLVEHPECDGTDPAIIAALSCSISMGSLYAADYYLIEGNKVLVTVQAMNSIDYSLPSQMAGEAVIQVAPHTPLTAPKRGSLTDETQVEVYFDYQVMDGGSPVATYSIEVDSGSGFAVVASSLTSPVIITSADVVSGAYLIIRYSASNIYGDSGYSPVVVILVATVPAPPTAAQSTADSLSTLVTLTWTAPVNTGGSGVAISEYLIAILTHDGVTFNQTSSCDGTQAAVITTASCLVPM